MTPFLYFIIGFVLSSLALNATSKYSDDIYTKFHHFNSRNGLSNNRILDIQQDHYGFIWIATGNGLNRYDGYTFRHYYHSSEDSTSLASNYITSIAFDNYKKMWVGTKEGLACYDEDNDSFERFPLHSAKVKGISDKYVRCIYADTLYHLLWVETVDGVLNRIDLVDNSVQHFKHEPVLAARYDYHSIYRDDQGRLIVGGRDFGPLLFDEEHFVFTPLPTGNVDDNKKRDADLACCFQDQENRLWMSATDGFYEYYPQTNTFSKKLATSTFDIIEAEEGNLWLGTGAGLFKYHKVEDNYTIYKHSINNSYSLINNHVNVLFLDRASNLWVGTSQGVSVLFKKNSLFKHYRHIPEDDRSMPFDIIRAITPVSDDKIWLGTHGEGAYEWSLDNQSITPVKGTEKQRINTIYKDKQGAIWLGMWSGTGFLKYDQQGQVTQYALSPNTLKRDWYNDFYEDHFGRFYAGIWGGAGVYFFNRKAETFENYTLRLLEAPHRSIIDKVVLQDGQLWTHWRHANIHRYDIDGKYYESFGRNDTLDYIFPLWQGKHRYHYDDQLTFNVVHRIYKDEYLEQSLWCTDDGLFSFYDGGFHQLYPNSFDGVYDVIRLDRECLCVLSDRGAFLMKGERERVLSLEDSFFAQRVFRLNNDFLMLVSDRDHQVRIYNLKEEAFVATDIDAKELEVLLTTKAVLAGDNPIVCTHKGMFVVNPDLKGYQLYDMSNSFTKGLISETINDIVALSLSHYCLATEKGLILFDANQGHFKPIAPTQNLSVSQVVQYDSLIWMATQNGLVAYDQIRDVVEEVSFMSPHKTSSHLTSFIEEDARGHIWVGTTDLGVNRIDTSDFVISHYLPGEKDEAFWGENATSFAVNDSGKVYIGSSQGVNMYDAEKDLFSHLTVADGLPSNNVLGIAFDNAGCLWMVTDKGLAIWNPQNESIQVFDEQWGIQTYMLNGNIVNIGDYMMVSSEQGVFAFSPEEVLRCETVTRTDITNFQVFAEDWKGDYKHSGKVNLKYNQNFFTISFSNFDFSEGEAQYYYQLEGVDPHWVNTFSNKASYTKISPGKYTFRVKNISHCSTSETIADLEIIIRPPIWKRWWFVSSEVMLLLLIAYGLYSQRVKHYKLRASQLELRQKLLRSQMNPHFVFNALIAIQSFIFNNEPKEAGRYLSKFAKLMRLFLQNTRHDNVKLDQEIETLTNYMELQSLRFDNAFDFEIRYDDNIMIETLSLPPMMAQPFIENAIEHGFKGIDYQGKIVVSYSKLNNALQIKITDNGVGITKGATAEGHKSLATVITRERLKTLSHRHTSYVLSINNLSENNKKEKGTEVVLTVPYKAEFTID